MDKIYIKDVIQKILDKEFTDPIRRRISPYSDRLNFCAPCCGDSSKNKWAKRGNLYFNNLFYICFNCGRKLSFDKLCKLFNEQLDPDKKMEMIEHLNNSITYSDYSGNMSDAKYENLINLQDLEKAISMGITPISDFRPIVVNGGVYKYLVNRGIDPELHKDIYQAKWWKNEDESEWIIVMLNRRDDKLLGLQIRNLKSGKRRMFKIFNYENLLEWINMTKETPIEIDMNEMVVYNKLSYYFNILNINYSKTVTIFEGYLDSLFYPNSIGLVGVNTDFKLIEGSGMDLQYFFDNDEAGFKKSEEKLKEGYPVFLWRKLFESIVDKKKPEDPFKLWNRIVTVKDINKLAELTKNPYSKFNLNDFFSKDLYDIKWIPKKSKKIKIEEDYNKKYDNMKFI